MHYRESLWCPSPVLQCADLSALLVRGGLRRFRTKLRTLTCDRSQATKALTGQRTPKKIAIQIEMNAEECAAKVQADLGDAWLPQIYRRVRSKPTRSYHFEGLRKKTRVEIQHTLLGVELQIGRRRLLCPDLATARYLSVFARAGCEHVAVPYDITKVSQIADELESSWYRMLLLIDHYTSDRTQALRARVARLLLAQVRGEISEQGAGALMPEFKTITRQRT